MRHGNFFIGQVAGRIRGPYVTAYSLSANAEIAAADVQPTAGGAATFNVLLFLLELAQQFIGSIHPDFRKRPVFDIAEAAVTPELISVNLAIPAYASDTPAGIVAFIPLEQLQDLLGSRGVLFEHSHVHEGAVSMIVDRQDFFRFSFIKQAFGLIDD
jgi:hypothetical protein